MQDHKTPWLWLAAVAFVVAAVALPRVLEYRARRQFEQLGDVYSGGFERLELRPFALEVVLRHVRIQRVQPRVKTPFLTVDALHIGLSFDGVRPLARVRAQRPVVNLVDFRDDSRDVWGPSVDLRRLREQLPSDLDQLKVEDGELHLRAFQAEPPLDVYLENFHGTWSALAACLPPGGDACDSTLKARADVQGHTPLRLEGSYRRGKARGLHLEGQLGALPARSVSPLSKLYTEVDVQGGEVAVDFQVDARGTVLDAVFVPRLQGVDVLGGDRGATRFGRELAAALAAGYFERRRGEKALRVRGRGGDLHWEVIDNPLKESSTASGSGR